MRVKTIWTWLPLPEWMKLAYSRVTLTPYTTAYFIAAFILCVTQLGLQLAARGVNSDARSFMMSILQQSGVDRSETVYAVLDPGNVLMLCNGLPGVDNGICTRLGDLAVASGNSTAVPTTSAPATSAGDYEEEEDDHAGHYKRSYGDQITPEFDPQTEALTGVSLTTSGSKTSVTLTPECVASLHWPEQVLHDALLEDVTFAGYHVWLFAMVVIAILNESIPHIVAAFISTILSTSWAASQISRSITFRQQFLDVVTNTHCNGIDLLPGYWVERLKLEAPILAIDLLALIVLAFLSWKLLAIFGWETFKRIGGSPIMRRAYIIVLVLTIFLQLGALFLVAGVVLWLDELYDGAVASFAVHAPIYRGVAITTVLLVVPWFVIGWIAIRRESKRLTYVFVGICVLFIVSHAAMFASPMFRFSFSSWPFFAMITVVAFILLLVTVGLTIMCILNFNLGLATFLTSSSVDGRADQVPWTFNSEKEKQDFDVEKVYFPNGSNGSLPDLPQLDYAAPTLPKFTPRTPSKPKRTVPLSPMAALGPTPADLRLPNNEDDDVLFDLPVTPTRAADPSGMSSDNQGTGPSAKHGAGKRNLWSIITNVNAPSTAATGAPFTAAYSASAYSATTSGWFDRDATLLPPSAVLSPLAPVAQNLSPSMAPSNTLPVGRFAASPVAMSPQQQMDQLRLPRGGKRDRTPSPVVGEKNRFI